MHYEQYYVMYKGLERGNINHLFISFSNLQPSLGLNVNILKEIREIEEKT